MKLHLQSIEKSFKDNQVLNDVSYTFENGKIYGLLGRNGAGKTTLFNIIYHELKADEGKVILEDNGEADELQVNQVGMVFAETDLPPFLTAYEYIKFILDISKPHELNNIDNYFDMMELNQRDRHKLIKDYSSGMKSKVVLLALYIQRPKVILLDEPLTAVDLVAGAEIKKFFRSFKNDHIIIVSTHMLDLAKDLCDEVVLLHEGKVSALKDLQKDESYESRIIEALREGIKEGNDDWCTRTIP